MCKHTNTAKYRNEMTSCDICKLLAYQKKVRLEILQLEVVTRIWLVLLNYICDYYYLAL